ncbi:guanylate kinase [Paenibacillus sp. MWE-103]|uniref:Guanylate kinase n=1 Tax=Paenibacillus artemisiicola TaxID=1172618 RepID=A0ABS3WBD4_9BACL|nr:MULTISPECIES: guanylate kinase [Paenibacillus]MBO7745623.1 guanylate kinase [Paenibacillus artemisiicola]SFI75550.1 guanylate kinase [Paenibacillus sp. UNC496MF]
MNNQPDRKLIFVFTGPDGSGRKTVADSVGTTLGIAKVLSYATRKPRPGEVNGQDYHFITPELYEQLESSGDFIESIALNGNRYGLRGIDIEQRLGKGGSIFLIVNPEGAQLLKEQYGDRLVRLFIYADRRTVEERQKESGVAPGIVQARMNQYESAIAYQSSCEHAFENYDLAHTVFEITNTLEHYLQRNLVERD